MRFILILSLPDIRVSGDSVQSALTVAGAAPDFHRLPYYPEYSGTLKESYFLFIVIYKTGKVIKIFLICRFFS
ncbi:hypothetical protein RKD52_002330 [Metabacillus sp. SLBN-84]